MTATRKLRMGLLGLGPIAQLAHLNALTKAHNVELLAVCDAAPDLLGPLAERYRVPRRYERAEQLWADADVEAVLIAVHDRLHAPLALAALRAGKHVLVEKPLAATVPECEELVTAARQAGRQLQVGCMKRFDPALQAAQRFVREELRQPYLVSGWFCDSKFHADYVRSLALPLLSGPGKIRPAEGYATRLLGHLIGFGVHALDLLRFFGGEIVAVNGLGREFPENKTAFVALLEYASGATGTLTLVCRAQMDHFEGLHVHGAGGSVIARVPFPYFKETCEVRIFDDRRDEYRTPACGDSDPYERQAEAFADAILSGRPVSPDGGDGLAAQKVLYAIYESQQNGGRRVEIAR